MGVNPPFLYDHPTRYSFAGPTEKEFDPKAASHSSWTPRAPKPKPEGPLINARELNRHPDSYFIVPYGQLDWKPLNPNTKTKVKWTRLTQLFLRVCALLGAAGLLVCVICIKGTDSTLGWIIRVAPSVAILHTIYGIYHLARCSKGRTPASSASYMLFAAIFDAGLIPFFVFTAIMAQAQYITPIDAPGQWSTLFGNDADTYKILYATFLISAVTGSIHTVSLFISVYLAVIFRKISKLPPDMNPLEDNLTSRHKRNKSSLSTATTENTNKEKYLSAPLIDAPRIVPFMHTRTDSSTSLSPQHRLPNSNRGSRTDLAIYQQPESQGSSRADLSRSPKRNYANSAMYAQPRSQQSSRADLSHSPQHSAKQAPIHTESRPASARPQPTPSPGNDNWFTYPSPSPSPANDGPPEFQHLRAKQNLPAPTQPQQRVNKYNFQNMTPRPLEMNPPTPPINSHKRTDERALAPMSGNAVGYENMNRPRYGRGDSGGTVRDNSRYYGNLNAVKNRVTSTGARTAERGGMRAREVSGKVAEEGRADIYMM